MTRTLLLDPAPAGGTSRILRGRWSVVPILVGISLFGCARETSTPELAESYSELAPAESQPPTPPLDNMEPVIAEALETRRSELETLLERQDLSDSERGRAIGEMGRLYQAHRLLDVAEACYLQAANLDAESFAWHYYVGVLAARRGEYDSASEALERALTLRPQDVPTLIRLGDLELDQGHPSEAQALYERVRELDQSLAAAEYGLGRVAIENRDFEEGARHLQRAIDLQPSADVLHYHLGQTYRQLGKQDLAQQHLSKSGQVKVAMPDPLLQELAGLTVGSSPHLLRGNVAFRDGRWSVAADQYRLALEADPEDLRAHQSLAMVLVRLGDLQGAAELFEAASVIAPDNARVQSDLGTTLAKIGDVDQAIEHLSRSVELEPDLERAHMNLANTLAATGRDREAIASYEKVIEIDPSNQDAHLRAGALLVKVGELDRGIEELRVVAENDPSNAEAQLGLGMALAQVGDLDGAIEHQAAALELQPSGMNRAFAYLNLAALYEEQGDLDQAAGNYARAARLEPQNEIARFRQAVSLMKMERFEEAGTVLEQALVELPDATHLKHALARLLASSPDQSLRQGRRALEMSALVLQADRVAPHAETFAMALSQVGEFEDAIQIQLSVLEEARERDRVADEERLARNLALYEASESCCAMPSDVLPAH